MADWAKSWKIIACTAVFASAASSMHGQEVPQGGIGAAAAQASAQALDLLNQGKLPEAEAAYSAVLSQYPTSPSAPEATYRLGYVQYLEGNYDSAVETLNKIVSPPASPEIKTAADALLPQVMSAKAGKMSPDDPNRKGAYGQAIVAFDDFIAKYPQSSNVESAMYGKAMAAYQIEDYDGAEKGLRTTLQRFPGGDGALESQDMLAMVLTAEGGDILNHNGYKSDAFAKYSEALQNLASIIESRADEALSNNAQFQIGEVLFDRANAEEGLEKTKDLTHAIDAYRAVQPNDAMQAALEAHIADLLARQRQAVLDRNPAAVTELQQEQDGASAKLAALKQAPDETLNAQLRIAASYFMLQKYDESRVMLRYLQPFIQDPVQKKQIEYYLVLTYAAQGLTQQAEEAYNTFQSDYRGDPMGENLPLVMGAAYLAGDNKQPDKAIGYFQQEQALYPASPLVNEALNQQASALLALHRYDEAIQTYQKFLGTHPPAEQAAEAQRGIAMIYQQTGKLADAVKQYQSVADDFPGTPMAEQCAFYSAALETMVDMKQALPQLQAYVAKYPSGELTPRALLMIGEAQVAQGDTEGAMDTFKEVVAKFPKSEFGPQACFQQASILGREGKTDDMVTVLKQYIQIYPDDKNLFYAYDTIGQAEVSKGDLAGAIATYSEMADQHGDNPMAPAALYKVTDLYRREADAMGNYQALSPAQKKDWDTAVSGSIDAAEQLLSKFPDSDQVGLGLKTLLADQQMLVAAGEKQPDDLNQYFHDLANKCGPAAKSRVLFTLATYTYSKDPVQGLSDMTAAYDPSVVYAPGDLDLYGEALLNQGNGADAYKLYQKIATDYPVPANTTPGQAAPTIQEAQATALFGMGEALDKQGQTAESGKMFTELKALYPWSPKVVEANFGIAKSMFAQNQLDDASKLLVGIVGSRTAPAPLRAHAFLLIGKIQEQKGNVDAAIDSYLKTAAYYSGVADAASEGLWRGGQMLEKQAAELTEDSTPKKSEQIAKAVTAYKELGTQYPDSPFVKQADDRLKALGAG
jgi:TolA-binding protein